LYSSFSHAFRNPLNGSLGYIDFLFKGYAGGLTKEQMGPLGQARDAALQLQRVVDALMDVAAFDLGLVRLESRPIRWSGFLEDFVRETREWAAAEKVSLSFKKRGDVWVFGDPQWMRRLLGEVMSNAVRVTPRGGRIQMILDRKGASARLQITDEGPGVPSDRRDWIFHPLAQLRRQGDPPPGDRGGLGLAIAARIAELHRGVLKAVPEGSGKGLSFLLELPAGKGP
jgi:signal transduction histidine kinase